jgi:hypothetical protein
MLDSKKIAQMSGMALRIGKWIKKNEVGWKASMI